MPQNIPLINKEAVERAVRVNNFMGQLMANELFREYLKELEKIKQEVLYNSYADKGNADRIIGLCHGLDIALNLHKRYERK
jgi:hypothetical protein